ncbi:MAG: hypothetical protein V3U19_09530 [Thermodesulfobacteriota bacterium]
MKAWKKGAIIGVVWGLISFIIGSQFVLRPISMGQPTLTTQILLAPFFVSINIIILLIQTRIQTGVDVAVGLSLLSIPLSILISALIGSMIGFAFEKYKQRRDNK